MTLKKHRIVWLTTARSPYNDFLFKKVAEQYDLSVVYQETSFITHPWQFDSPPYKYLMASGIFFKLYQMCRKADLLVINGWGFWDYLLLAAIFHRKKKVYWVDALPVERGYFCGVKGKIRRLVSKYVFRSFTQVWGTGKMGCNTLKKAGCSESKIKSFPYVNDIDGFRKITPNQLIEAQKFRQSHTFCSNSIVFFGLGQLKQIKRYADCIEAIARVNDPRAVLWIGGTGPEMAALINQAKIRGVAQKVFFLGWLQPNEVEIAYMATDVFVHPAEFEPWGVVVSDAMSWGKPVIGSCFASSVIDYVKPDMNGFIVEPGNIEQIVNAMQFFVDHRDAIVEYGREARTTAERYTVESGLAALDQVIKLS